VQRSSSSNDWVGETENCRSTVTVIFAPERVFNKKRVELKRRKGVVPQADPGVSTIGKGEKTWTKNPVLCKAVETRQK